MPWQPGPGNMRWSQYIHFKLDFSYFGSILRGCMVSKSGAKFEQFSRPYIEWLSLSDCPLWKRDRFVRFRICGGFGRACKFGGVSRFAKTHVRLFLRGLPT